MRTTSGQHAVNASSPPSSGNLPQSIPKAEATNWSLVTIKAFVLVILCLQNSTYTLLRRYSQGTLEEKYSKYELLLSAEAFKMIFSVYMIWKENINLCTRLSFVLKRLWKMFFLAVIYGLMNILSLVALRNIGAGIFTILAQCKILSTATFSSIMLGRQYSSVKWRALASLVVAVILFSERVWNNSDSDKSNEGSENPVLGVIAVVVEVTLSGFASIYFEKVIKTDPEKLTIWENNFNLAIGSVPIYIGFIMHEQGGEVGYGGGWSPVTWTLSMLGAAGGLLVALSIKYGDSVLKTLATSGAIVLSSVLDKFLLDGELTPIMVLAGILVILSISNYTFDPSPPSTAATKETPLPISETSEETVELLEKGKANE